MEQNVGYVVQIIGPVIDIRFESENLPAINNAIEIHFDGKKLSC